MNPYFAEYLSMSPYGRIEYLKFIIELADIAIRSQGNPEIKPETVEKAYRAKEQAEKELAAERSYPHEQRKRDDRCL